MLFIGITIVFLLSLNGVLSQGVFDPYSYTEASCTGNYRWTSWFDTNDPNLTQGDPELTSHIKQLFGSFMCSTPIAIEGRTSLDGNPAVTGDVFRISTNDGFLCLNPFVVNYKHKLCNDYKVRYCCPNTMI